MSCRHEGKDREMRIWMTVRRYRGNGEAATERDREYKQDRFHGGSSELAASIASCGPITNNLVEAAATCRVIINTAASDDIVGLTMCGTKLCVP
jgi:hydroxymethylpyrimidine/phosphomethylpyrimidine kinase